MWGQESGGCSHPEEVAVLPPKRKPHSSPHYTSLAWFLAGEGNKTVQFHWHIVKLGELPKVFWARIK